MPSSAKPTTGTLRSRARPSRASTTRTRLPRRVIISVRPRSPVRCTAAVARTAADVARTRWPLLRSTGLGRLSGNPGAAWYAYFGGGVSCQPTEITSIGVVIRTRHVGMTAAIVAAIELVSWCWTRKEHVEFNDDMVISALVFEPLHPALGLAEHVFRTLLTGASVEKPRASSLHKGPGTRGTEPQRPRPEELRRVRHGDGPVPHRWSGGRV